MDRIAGSFSRQVQTSPIIDLCATESNPDFLKVPRNFEVFRTTAAKSEGAYFPAVGSAIRQSAPQLLYKIDRVPSEILKIYFYPA